MEAIKEGLVWRYMFLKWYNYFRYEFKNHLVVSDRN
jgi:hypothetical protein